MKEVTIRVPDNKYNAFMKVVKGIDYVELEPKKKQLSKKQQLFADELKQALEQVEAHLQGKIKLKSAREFLNEL